VRHVESEGIADAPLVLVIDDEPILTETISYSLQREGWRTAVAADGTTAIEMARALEPDAIVLDVMLPGVDGLQVCRAIRAESTVPILFLSARAEDVDRILGLEIGGDDYLTKPFVMRELVARVRANLRRSALAGRESSPGYAPVVPSRNGDQAREELVVGPLRLSLTNRVVSLDNHPIALKPKEFDLLAYLMAHPGRVISREALLREVWKYTYTYDTRTVDVHVRGLRQKIEQDSSHPRFIETVRGFGYRFNSVEPAS
jgi:two-component system, OmpR family, alkaline phosphatase synthesis response regulator PhoP